MKFKLSEKGQSLTEYALILVLVAIVVIVIGCICTSALWLPLVAIFWPQIVAGGTWLVSNVQEGNPKAIFIVILIGAFVLWLIFGHRRRA